MPSGFIHIGTSGWYYDHWQDVLYPPGLPKAKRFEAYAERYATVEVNATFYRLHDPGKLFASPYSDEWLTELASDLLTLAQKDVPNFTFFNNDLGGHAVRNADTLIARVNALW